MADPFLHAHRLRTRVFDLGRRTPVSIRDQLLRSHYLVERLVASRYLHSRSQVLVVGAGVAGVSTAILAAQAGASVVLVDARAQALGLQRSCATRWIDPTQYDWPAGHASQARWPVAASRVASPLGFAADFADRLAARWTNVLSLMRITPGVRIRPFYGATISTPRVIKPASGATRVQVRVNHPSAGGAPTHYHVVILARGFAQERTEVKNHVASGSGIGNPPRPPMFTGHKFWETDPFTGPNFGLPLALTGDVLVSGAGDGALQDYIRLTTGRKSAIEVLDAVLPDAGRTGSIRRYMGARIADLELQAQRALAWNETEEQDHRVLKRLHAQYRALLAGLRRRVPADWSNLMTAIDVVTSGRQPERVYLVHGCEHFSACYALNHFVALLIDGYIRHELGLPARVIGRARVDSVSPAVTGTGATHACPATPNRCWGYQHVVRIGWGHSCIGPRPLLMGRSGFDGVVIRHGVQFVGPLGPPMRQVLPLHVPEP